MKELSEFPAFAKMPTQKAVSEPEPVRVPAASVRRFPYRRPVPSVPT